MEDRFRNMEGRMEDRMDDERANHEMKKRAFEGKEGYSHHRYEEKLKDQMNGMPMPEHMRKEKY